jgi:hypothetical protein
VDFARFGFWAAYRDGVEMGVWLKPYGSINSAKIVASAHFRALHEKRVHHIQHRVLPPFSDILSNAFEERKHVALKALVLREKYVVI